MLRMTMALFLMTAVSLPAEAAPDREAIKKACHNDYNAFCDGIAPGGGRILACLQQHAEKLSADCKAVLPTK